MLDKGEDCGQNGEAYELSLADRWIISQLQRTEAEVTRHLDQFRFDLAAQALYEFIWNQYCDWYLELSKPVLWDENAPVERQRGTRRTLVRVLEVALRLAHPFMPFITEEIWQRIAPLAGVEGKTIMLQPWPVPNEARIDQAAEDDIEWLKGLMLGTRNIRGEMNIGPAAPGRGSRGPGHGGASGGVVCGQGSLGLVFARRAQGLGGNRAGPAQPARHGPRRAADAGRCRRRRPRAPPGGSGPGDGRNGGGAQHLGSA